MSENSRLTAAVITVSDLGFRGQREDTSGPALCGMLRDAGWKVVHTTMVPDEADLIEGELLRCADMLRVSLVLTTGGTGFSPRDVTPEATLAVVERSCPGIPEVMRAESMKITPRGCLSRETAGIRGSTLIINLPGSRKASTENLSAVLEPIRHGVEMLRSAGSANCAEAAAAANVSTGFSSPEHRRTAVSGVAGEPIASDASVHGADPLLPFLSFGGTRPSAEAWLQEAKSLQDAGSAGMYLLHNGVVRQTSRSQVREGDENAPPVTGMLFSCDRERAKAAVACARQLPGVICARVWLAEGCLQVGDDIMQVLIGADIRPHAVQALETLVGRLKQECVTEQELYEPVS